MRGVAVREGAPRGAGAALAVATADGAYGECATNATRNVRRSVLGTFETKRRAELAAVALLDATDERDGSSLGEARELTLGFLKRRGDDAWRDLSVLSTLSTLSATSNDAADSDSRYDASIDAFLGTLERHVSSGCHGAAEASAPSVLPLLAALPRGALFREEVRLRRLLASLWEGYALCNVPSRSADAAALLRAFREATLYGAIVVAEEGESERESERAANAEAFRAELFRDAFLKRWIPEALRVTSLTEKTESDGSSSRALDAPLVTASLCECLVGVSRRPALAETCLRATMERTAADCERMVSGSSPGGRVDAPGARRVAAFHAALCDAAERRDAKDKKEKTTLSDGNVSAKRSADTARRALGRARVRAADRRRRRARDDHDRTHRSRRRAPVEPRRETRRVVSRRDGRRKTRLGRRKSLRDRGEPEPPPAGCLLRERSRSVRRRRR